MSSPLNFHLEQYDGPLDLLLDLIRKQQIEIKDIPIATITSQYLEYMDKAREMDIDLGAEFVYMAATLIHIKSRMLLPRDPALVVEGDASEDPRQELVDRLLEHERFKNAAEMLQQKRMIEENVWSNPQIKAFVSEEYWKITAILSPRGKTEEAGDTQTVPSDAPTGDEDLPEPGAGVPGDEGLCQAVVGGSAT